MTRQGGQPLSAACPRFRRVPRAQLDCTICAACKSARFSSDFHRLCSCVSSRKLRIMAAGTYLRSRDARDLRKVVYSRADLLRILHLTPRQLANWERAELIAAATTYSFSDLLKIKKVRDLCAMRVRPAVIRRSLEAMQKQASGMGNPLVEASVSFTNKHRVAFRHEGRLLEPIAGQFVMDFATREKVVTSTPVPTPEPGPQENEAAVWFARGIALEEDPATQTEALAAYLKVLEFESGHAAAHINLGTLYYNRQDFAQAERHYRAALQADSRYALAYFDLGNVLDETGRVQEAIQTYKMAIQLAPTYADAHYNLALAFEKTREPRKALKHWQAYIKLDTTGPWSVHARNQIQRILQADSLKLVHSRRG
jgi:tetratricopeptide (TPR) repeat protein